LNSVVGCWLLIVCFCELLKNKQAKMNFWERVRFRLGGVSGDWAERCNDFNKRQLYLLKSMRIKRGCNTC
jgi:hypothetical protein